MFGVPLFKRDRRGMRPNAHGDLIKRHFNVVMSDVGHIATSWPYYASGGAGVVRLASSVVSAQCLPTYRRPAVDLHLTMRGLTEAPPTG